MAKKRKQNKVAWRRRGAEFEEAAQRVHRAANQDRRTGAGKLSALADDQLFSLEPGAAGGGKLASARKRRSAADEPPKQLWVDRVVAPNPHIDTVVKPAVSSSKPGAPSRGTLLVREKLGKIQKASARTVAHRAATAAAAAARAAAALVPSEAANPLDIWGGAASNQPVSRVSRRGAARRQPESSTAAAAVVPPAGGASWNPDFAAHQALLAEATQHELARQAKERHHRMGGGLFRHIEDYLDENGEELPPGAVAEVDAAVMAEARDDTEIANAAEEEDDDEDDEEEDGEEGARQEQRATAPLTSAQRNRRQRAKELEARAKAEKAARQREKQAGRVGNLLAEISKEDKAREHKRQEEAEWEAARPKKLGPRRYEAKRPDVLLSDEQPAALRLVRQEKSLLDDRFESMQARNLVEVRERRAAGESRRHRRTVLRESAKDTKYKSPFGIPGPKPAWL